MDTPIVIALICVGVICLLGMPICLMIGWKMRDQVTEGKPISLPKVPHLRLPRPGDVPEPYVPDEYKEDELPKFTGKVIEGAENFPGDLQA